MEFASYNNGSFLSGRDRSFAYPKNKNVVVANALGVSSGAGIPVMRCLDLIGRVAGNGDHKMERA